MAMFILCLDEKECDPQNKLRPQRGRFRSLARVAREFRTIEGDCRLWLA
jgi:hypothetical protein